MTSPFRMDLRLEQQLTPRALLLRTLWRDGDYGPAPWRSVPEIARMSGLEENQVRGLMRQNQVVQAVERKLEDRSEAGGRNFVAVYRMKLPSRLDDFFEDDASKIPFIVAGSTFLLGIAALAWSFMSDQSAPPPAPSEAPTEPPPPPTPAPRATPPSGGGKYLTTPENIGEPVWMPFGSDKEIAVLIPDLHTGGYAHASYASSLEAAAKYGATLPTHEDMIALSDQARAAGLELDPVILPGASHELTVEGAKPGDPAMMTERWVDIHDDLVKKQLDARHWDGKTAVSNAGKVWIAGAPHGRAYLMGWRQKNGSWIQAGSTEGQGPHDDQHVDYSMLLTLVRPRAVA